MDEAMIDDAVKVTLRWKTFLVSKEAYDALGEEFLDLVLEDQGYWEAEERYQKRKRDDAKNNCCDWSDRNHMSVMAYILASGKDFGENEMTNSRAKGARGERELAKVLREHGYDTRRGQQFCGANGDADVVGLPCIHIECKRVGDRLNLDKAMEQSKHVARADEVPVVMHRKDRHEWLVTMRLEDWVKFYERWDAFNAE